MASFLKNQTKAFSKLLLILIVVAVLAAVGVLSWTLLRQPQESQPKPPEQEVLPVKGLIKTDISLDKEADFIKNCVGKVEEIKENVIRLRAESDRNLFKEERTFEVIVTEQTEILSSTFYSARVNVGGRILFEQPAFLTQGLKSAEQQKVSLADIKKGDLLAVLSEENLREKEVFSAKVIYYLVQK